MKLDGFCALPYIEHGECRLVSRNGHTFRRFDPLWAALERGTESKYLLVGLARCSVCGAGLSVRSRQNNKAGRRYFYVCTAYHTRGLNVCPNAAEWPMDAVNAALLGGIGEQVLSPRLLDLIVRRTVDLWESPEITGPTPIKRELDQVERELSRLTDALISGGDLATVVAAIRDREDRRRALREHLEAISGRQTPKLDPHTVTRLAHERLNEWRDVLTGQVPIARQLLRKLFTERLLVTPVDATGQPIADHAEAESVKISGSATFSEFFAGIVCSKGLARPTGFEDEGDLTKQAKIRGSLEELVG